MKLLYCPSCHDVFILKLTAARNTPEVECQCGQAAGYYIDSSNAVHNGKGVPFMIHNSEFLTAVNRQQSNSREQLEHVFYAAVLPEVCKTLKVVPEWRHVHLTEPQIHLPELDI